MISLTTTILWNEAICTDLDEDGFVEEWGMSSLFGNPMGTAIDPDTIEDEEEYDETVTRQVEYVSEIWKASKMPMKDMIKAKGMTQQGFSVLYGIPVSTVESWCRKTREMPSYLRMLLAFDMGFISNYNAEVKPENG